MSSKCSSTCKSSSISKKLIMGITGLLLCGFVLTHLLGNFTLFIGSDAFNKYSHALTSNPLIYLAEAVLFLIFFSHIVLAIKLTRENKLARPINYYVRTTSGRGATFASSSMIYSGLITFVFLIIHITGLKFGTHYDTTVGGIEMRDIYRTTIEYFRDPIHLMIYLVAVISLGIHVSHGLWSAFQSLGLSHPKYTPKIHCLSKVYGFIVAIGFSTLAIFCYLQGGH